MERMFLEVSKKKKTTHVSSEESNFGSIDKISLKENRKAHIVL